VGLYGWRRRPTATLREFVWRKGRGAMGKVMSRKQRAAKSPQAKKFEKKLVRTAEDPKTPAKISRGFRKSQAKH